LKAPVTFDAYDALVAARFWAAALGSDVDEDSTSEQAFVEAPSRGPRQEAESTGSSVGSSAG
jgi:glyoxalase superfamily protein